MKTLKSTQNKTNKTRRIIQALLLVAISCIASDVFSQTKEVEFDVYTNSATKASKYLLGDDVALRDCASVHCEQLTTINIGTNVRLLAKSKIPQTINGITSRWYKIKMGPQVGWIWGGLISQKTMVSNANPEVKFVFGEAGYDYKGNKQFQIRALKNGEQIDKIVFKSERLNAEDVTLNASEADVINLSQTKEGEAVNTSYIVFKDNALKQTKTLVARADSNKTAYVPASLVFCVDGEN